MIKKHGSLNELRAHLARPEGQKEIATIQEAIGFHNVFKNSMGETLVKTLLGSPVNKVKSEPEKSSKKIQFKH